MSQEQVAKGDLVMTPSGRATVLYVHKRGPIALVVYEVANKSDPKREALPLSFVKKLPDEDRKPRSAAMKKTWEERRALRNTPLTAEALRELIEYDPESGLVKRLSPPPGAKNGSRHSHGYTVLFVRGKLYKIHRLAWLYMTGHWPEGQIDHINGDRSDNRWANLRETDTSGNLNQRRPRADNKTGYLGVSPILRKRMPTIYKAQIRVKGQVHVLGTFDTPEAAHSAYLQAKRELHAHCTI